MDEVQQGLMRYAVVRNGDLASMKGGLVKSFARVTSGAFLVMLATIPNRVTAAEPATDLKPAWVWLGQAETATYIIRETKWERIAQLVPGRLGVLSADVLDDTGRKPVLKAGSYMIGFDENPGFWCEFERPIGRFKIVCVDDTNRDGRMDSLVHAYLQHPYFFSAVRLKGAARPLGGNLATVTVRPSSERTVDFLLFYANHAEWGNQSEFGYCVFRRDNRNILGDKSIGRSCLGPGETIKDKGFPFTRELYGRRIEFLSREKSQATVRVSGPAEALRMTF